MCKLLIGINQTNKENKEFENLIKAQESDLKKETDGIGSIVIDKDNKLHIFRSLANYTEVFEKTYSLLNEARLVGIHTRNRTSGNTDLENVHFFEIDDYLFAHNGFVSKYHRYGSYHSHNNYGLNSYGNLDLYGKKNTISVELENDDDIAEEIIRSCGGCLSSNKGFCKKHKLEYYELIQNKSKTEISVDYSDSYQFLKNLPKPITTEIIEKEVKDKGFTGFGFLINKKTKTGFFIVKKDVNLKLDENNKVGVFGSYKLENEYVQKEWGQFCGINFVKSTDKQKINFKNYTIPEGIYKLKI